MSVDSSSMTSFQALPLSLCQSRGQHSPASEIEQLIGM